MNTHYSRFFAPIIICTLFLISGIFHHSSATEILPLSAFKPDTFVRGTIIDIYHTPFDESSSTIESTIHIRIHDGPEMGQMIVLTEYHQSSGVQQHDLALGQTIILRKSVIAGETSWSIYDTYRIPSLTWMLGIFFALVIIFGRLRGLTSIIGLGISLCILALYIVPKILHGADPLITTLIGAFAIAILSIYAAHGFHTRTSIAVVSTMITLGLAALLSLLFVSLARLSGLGSEHAFYLAVSEDGSMLNFTGLLLGGILIGTLGVLDDITTAQTAVVDELKKANPQLSRAELYVKAISVGKEHIASLVNTLVLAYAGASFPLFLLFTVNPAHIPLWVIINSEFMMEEIIRTLVGSSALVLAVPITTYLASYVFSKNDKPMSSRSNVS